MDSKSLIAGILIGVVAALLLTATAKAIFPLLVLAGIVMLMVLVTRKRA